MTIFRIIALVCDGSDGAMSCDEEFGQLALGQTIELRRMARKEGWVHFRGKDYCPDHAPERDR